MQLLLPIKLGIRYRKGFTTNTTLESLAQFKDCLTQGFGDRAMQYGQYGLLAHNGIDLFYQDGTEVFASHDGVCERKDDGSSSYGKYYTVTGNGFKTYYAHLKSYVRPDGPVKVGELLGLGDSTGNSTGPHLHFTVKRINKAGNVLNQSNGYSGAVDPMQYLVFPGMADLRRAIGGLGEVYSVVEVVDPETNTLSLEKNRVGNADGLLTFAKFSDVVEVPQSELDAIKDGGKVIVAYKDL